MRDLKTASSAALLVAAIMGAIAIGVWVRGVSQPTEGTPSLIPKSTTAVIADACNACVQAVGCDHKLNECTGNCNSNYPPNDPRGARCLASCQKVQDRCVRDAHKTCQACRP